MREWDIRNELSVSVYTCVHVCLGLKLWIPACKKLYEFNMRVVEQRVDSWKEEEHLFMDEYSATDHSVILTQRGEAGGGNAKTNREAASDKKKRNKSF